MNRNMIMMKRDPSQNRAILLQTIIMALMMMACFWQVADFDSYVSIKNTIGAIYFLVVVQWFLNFFGTLLVF